MQFYLDLVHEEVSIAKREETRRHDVDVQLPLPALIPEHYIADPVTRTAIYQHLARASTTAQLKLEYDKLVGQYGKPPTEVINLYYILGLQHAAAQLNISKIVSQRVTPPGEDAYWQIKLTTHQPQAVRKKIDQLGSIRQVAEGLVWATPAITPTTVARLCQALQTK